MSAWDFTFYLRALPPLFLLWLAWVITRSPFQRRLNKALSAFLVVVALGFLAEFWKDMVPWPPLGRVLSVLQYVLGLIDPPILFAYAVTLAGRARILRSPLTWIAFLPLAATLVISRVQMDAASNTYLFWEAAYVSGTYILSFAILVEAFLAETRPYLRKQLSFVALAVGFAGFSRSAALLAPLSPSGFRETASFWNPALPTLALALVLLSGVMAVGVVRHGRKAAAAHRIHFWLAATLFLFFTLWAITWAVRDTGPVPRRPDVIWYYYGYRWIVIGLILGYGVLRYQLFDFELRWREAIGFLLGLVAGLVSAIAAASWADTRGLGMDAAKWIGFTAGVGAASAAFAFSRRLVPRAARGDPPDFYRRRLEIYESTMEYAMKNGDWSGQDLFIETLRDVLDITQEEHAAIVTRIRRASPDRAPGDS